MNTDGKREFLVRSHFGHCGDNLCCISAAIEFAEKIDGVVYVDFWEDVVQAYNHPRLRYGDKGVQLHILAVNLHRNKTPGFFKNILGTYYAEFGLPINDPVLRLPTFEPCERRALIQPYSAFAENPTDGFIQGIVDEFVYRTGKRLFVVGDSKTPRTLRNVDYSLVRDGIPFFMQQVQNAECILTPRSFAANLAAGYRIPAFMWSPLDGEDWHLDYSTWRGVKCNFGQASVVPALLHLRKFIVEFGLGKGIETICTQLMEGTTEGEQVDHDDKQHIGIEQ